VAGDGYSSSGLTSVNTENERFAGLTVAKAAEVWQYAMRIDVSSAQVMGVTWHQFCLSGVWLFFAGGVSV